MPSVLHSPSDLCQCTSRGVGKVVFSANCYQSASYGDSCKLWRPYSPPTVTWYVDNVEICQTGDCQIVFTADSWCRLIIRDVMLKDEAEYTVRAVNEAGTCIGTAYLTVLPATAGERTAKELIEQESTGVTVTIRIRPDDGLRRRSPWPAATFSFRFGTGHLASQNR